MYSSVRPFGISAIVGGWDSEAELPVDGQVGSGPECGSGGKVKGAKAGGPGLFMIEPSGAYWVRHLIFLSIYQLWKALCINRWDDRATMALRQAKDDKPRKPSWRN